MRIPLFSAITCLAGFSFVQPVHAASNSQGKESPAVKKHPAISHRSGQDFTMFFTAELLYWKWNGGGLDFVRTGVGIPNVGGVALQDTPVTKTGGEFGPDFQFDTGFRVGAGVYFGANNAYDISVKYTHFHTHAKGSFDRSKDLATSALALTWAQSAQINTSIVHFANIDVKPHFNWIDLVTGYSFGLTPNLLLRPYAGLAGFFIDGRLRVFFDIDRVAQAVGHEKIVHKARYSAFGLSPVLGIESNWSFAKNWSFFGVANFYIPYFWQKLRAVQRTNQVDLGNQFISMHSGIHQTRLSQGFDFLLGPQWDVWFCKSRCHLTIRAAGELIFFNGFFLQFLSGGDNDAGIGAQIQGLNVAAAFEF